MSDPSLCWVGKSTGLEGTSEGRQQEHGSAIRSSGPTSLTPACASAILLVFSLKHSQTLHSFSMKPFPCALSQQILLRSRSLSSLQPLWVLAGRSQLSPEPSLLQSF